MAGESACQMHIAVPPIPKMIQFSANHVNCKKSYYFKNEALKYLNTLYNSNDIEVKGAGGLVYDFGARLKELREKKHLSQTEAGKKLGVTRSTISAYENNTKTPSLEVFANMAVLYNSSLDYIMGFTERKCVYLDDLTESQQHTVLDIVERLKQEFKDAK